MKSFEEYTIKELGDLLSQMAEVVRLREEEKGVEFFEGGEEEPPRPKIIPAEPLRIVPEIGERFWFVYIQILDRSCYTGRAAWSNVWDNYIFLQAGLIFPDTPEGKLGAELRAKEGIVPYPVQPAKALTEAPKDGARYWTCDDNENVVSLRWGGDDVDLEYLEEGRCFPHNLRGKIGAAMF